MRVEMELDPGVDRISGRYRGPDGAWHQVTGWTELVAEVERIRTPHPPQTHPVESAASDVIDEAGGGHLA